MKTSKQIWEEIKKLEAVLPRIKRSAPFSIFGDDNVASIEAQVEVLRETKDEDEIWDDYPDEEYIRNSALDAWNWLADLAEEIPSEGWEELANAREKR